MSGAGLDFHARCPVLGDPWSTAPAERASKRPIGLVVVWLQERLVLNAIAGNVERLAGRWL